MKGIHEPKNELKQLIYRLKDDLSNHLKDKFGIAPEKTTLKLYEPKDWKDFCTNNNEKPAPGGLYFPDRYEATVLLARKSETIQTLFHEYFGHGMYAEHSTIAQDILELEQIVPLEDPYLTSDLNGLLRMLRVQDEGFAVWMQWYLSRQTGQEKEFRKDLTLTPHDIKVKWTAKKFIEYTNKHDEYALMRKCGFHQVKRNQK